VTYTETDRQTDSDIHRDRHRDIEPDSTDVAVVWEVTGSHCLMMNS